MSDLNKRVAAIEERNRRVEADKAWEISWTRRILIAVLTYLLIGSFLFVIENERPWVNALVPAAGFLLSTLAVGIAKRQWLRRRPK